MKIKNFFKFFAFIIVFSLLFYGREILPTLFLSSPQKVIYDLSMVDLWVRKFFQKPWFDQIDDQIYLGALPLKNLRHLDILHKDLGIHSVISILEPFEVHVHTLLSQPVSSAEWKEIGVDHVLFSSPDMHAIELKKLNCIVDHIEAQVAKGLKIYLHCKAGRGRSASAVAGYFIKYRQMTALQAIELLQKKRSQISLNNMQIKGLLNYEKMNRSKYTKMNAKMDFFNTANSNLLFLDRLQQ